MSHIKTIRTFFLSTLLLVLFSSSAWAGAQDFVLVNRTGYDIYVLNVSPSNAKEWQEDLLGSQILANGEALQVNFNVGKQQYWDIQVKFQDGSGLYWMHLDLLHTSMIALNKDGTATLK